MLRKSLMIQRMRRHRSPRWSGSRSRRLPRIDGQLLILTLVVVAAVASLAAIAVYWRW
jgi:hypothetical protein